VLIEGELHAIMLCNGTYLEYRNQRILSSAQPVSWCELARRGSEFELTSPERDLVTLHAALDREEPLSEAIQSSERLEQ
jgi:hypothetical protein